MTKIIKLILIIILFALSFLIMLNLPEYIVENGNYSTLAWVMWIAGFSIAIVKTYR